METRIQRYAVYRKEIINEGMLLDKLSDDSITTKQLKERIDEISPKILADLRGGRSLAKLISVNTNDMNEINLVNKYMSLIESKRINDLTNEINEWNAKFVAHSVLDESGNISKRWLNEDANYSRYITNKERLEILQNKWSDFQITSKDQVGRLEQLSQEENNLNVTNDLNTVINYDNTNGTKNKLLYIFPIVFSLISLIMMITLLGFAVK